MLEPAAGLVLRTLLLALFTGFFAPAAGQSFEPRDRRVRDLVLEVDARPYSVEGNTAQAIYDGLGSGPGGWMSTSTLYTWAYRTSGGNLGSCGLRDFEVEARVDLSYPVWQEPDDADPALVEAWADFSSQMEEAWDEFVDEEISFWRSVARSVERIPEPCRVADQAVRRQYERVRNQPPGELWVTVLDSERLRWPPEGSEMSVSASGLRPTPTDRGPRSPVAESFISAAGEDFSEAGVEGATMVLGILRDGSVLGAEAVRLDTEGGEGPPTDAVFPFPGLTEVLIGTLVHAVEAAGLVQGSAPIATYLPGLDGALGEVTLEQLLGHRAGLNNSRVPEASGGVGPDAVFTEPGAVFSWSRHSYPLAARVLEAVLGSPLDQLIQQAVLNPMQLVDTRVGPSAVDPARLAPGVTVNRDDVDTAALPVVYTTIPDLSALLEAYMSGQVVWARPPTPATDGRGGGAAPTRPTGDDALWYGGLWWHEVDGVSRTSLICGPDDQGSAVGFALLPSLQSGMALWARGIWPHRAARFVLASVTRGLDGPADPYWQRGPSFRSSAEATTWDRCEFPATVTLESLGLTDGLPVPDADDWVGRYVNGDRAVGLVAADGELGWDGDGELRVRLARDDLYMAVSATGPQFPLQLIRDTDGRRYVVVKDLAYVHAADRGS